MKLKTIVGVVLIVFGVVALADQIISYTTLGQDMNIGSMRLSTGRGRGLPAMAILGVLALIGGVALFLVDKGDLKPTATP